MFMGLPNKIFACLPDKISVDLPDKIYAGLLDKIFVDLPDKIFAGLPDSRVFRIRLLRVFWIRFLKPRPCNTISVGTIKNQHGSYHGYGSLVLCLKLMTSPHKRNILEKAYNYLVNKHMPHIWLQNALYITNSIRYRNSMIHTWISAIVYLPASFRWHRPSFGSKIFAN